MTSKRKKADRAITNRIIIIFVGALALFFLYTIGSYWLFSAETNINVVDKRIEYSEYNECVWYSANGCARRELITHTAYIIITPDEEFETNEEVYGRIEVGRNHKVRVSGWQWSVLNRRVEEVQDLTIP